MALLHSPTLTRPVHRRNPNHPLRTEELCRRPRLPHNIALHDPRLDDLRPRDTHRIHPHRGAAVAAEVVDAGVAGCGVALKERLEHGATGDEAESVVGDDDVGAEGAAAVSLAAGAMAEHAEGGRAGVGDFDAAAETGAGGHCDGLCEGGGGGE